MSSLGERIKQNLAEDILRIEEALAVNLNPRYETVKRIAGHLLFAGGKRLRPLLTVLSARICGYESDFAYTMGAVFEYLHAATLLHDDLVDNAVLRRNKKAAHLLWGRELAVLTGDFLLARSLSIAAMARQPEIVDVIAHITELMSQGEIRQLERKKDISLTESEYMEVIRYKTAALIQGACRVGAILAGSDDQRQKALADYGYHLGIAFQIADDLLDYTADEKELGKQTGTDLKEGKLTLPLIFVQGRAMESDRRRIEDLILKGSFSKEEFSDLLKMMEDYGGFLYAREKAASHVAAAKDSLLLFDTSDTKKILMDIAEYSLIRDH